MKKYGGGLDQSAAEYKGGNKMNDFERFYIGENPILTLQQCKDSFEDLGLTRVSSSNRYSENLNPPMTEKTVKKPGEDGQYYFSTDLGATNHSINVAFDNLSEEQLRQLKQIQSSKSFWRLTYDNVPYKYYNVKPTGTSKLSYVPFLEDGIRKYKGEGMLEFVCYEGCAHCWVDSKDEFYIDPTMTTPKKRFENIDEWKNSCGLFNETKIAYKEVQMNFSKSIENNTLLYQAEAENTKGFFINNAEKVIKIKQLKDSLSNKVVGLKSTFTFSKGSEIVNTIEKNWVPDNITLDFSQEKATATYDSNDGGIQKEIFDKFEDDFTKITWKIYGSYIETKTLSSSNFVDYNVHNNKAVVLTYSFSSELSAGAYELSLDTFISLGVVQDFDLTIMSVINENMVLGDTFYNAKIKQQSNASVKTNFSVYSDSSISTISLYFIFNKDIILYGGTGTVSASIGSNDINDKRTMVLKYPSLGEGNNIDFSKEEEKGFYYTCYTNFGDKEAHPIITFENTSSTIKKVGIYLSSGLTSQLQIPKEQYDLFFDINIGTYIIDNERCLLTRNKEFDNGKITWGDFFTISEKESCFIYLVCFNENGTAVNLSTSPLGSTPKIQMNYLYY